MYKPLADEIRPDSLEDVVGQQHILGENGMLRSWPHENGNDGFFAAKLIRQDTL